MKIAKIVTLFIAMALFISSCCSQENVDGEGAVVFYLYPRIFDLKILPKNSMKAISFGDFYNSEDKTTSYIQIETFMKAIFGEGYPMVAYKN